MKMPGCLEVLARALQVFLYTPSTTEAESSRSCIVGCGFLGYVVAAGLWTVLATYLPTTDWCCSRKKGHLLRLARPSFCARENKEKPGPSVLPSS